MPNAIIYLCEAKFEFIDRTADIGVTAYSKDMLLYKVD
jgi:hypothetical protein